MAVIYKCDVCSNEVKPDLLLKVQFIEEQAPHGIFSYDSCIKCIQKLDKIGIIQVGVRSSLKDAKEQLYKSSSFKENCERAAELVDKMPDWKKNWLENSDKPTCNPRPIPNVSKNA